MERPKITGAGAGVMKYDVLTALSLWALRGSAAEQMSGLRLVALVTARYNWARDDVSIGQRDLARLWGVTERTVKREMRRLQDLGILQVARPGVRGRVASYRLVPEVVAALSEAHWDAVGPDFVERFEERRAAPVRQEGPSVLRVDFGQLRGAEPVPGDPWAALQAWLRAAAPSAYSAWFAPLQLVEADAEQVVLVAPSAFVQRYIETHHMEVLRAGVAQVFGAAARLEVRA